MTPRGRRPLGADTRGDILAAARKVFATEGYTSATLRGIAREAEVDASLVHHYFDGKVDLFVQAVLAPVPPEQEAGPPQRHIVPREIIVGIARGPRDEVGRRWVRAFLETWDSQGGGERFAALLRSAVSSDAALAPLRQFLVAEVFGPVVQALDVDHPELRAQLAGSQLIGLGLARYLGKLPQLVDIDIDILADIVGPNVQRYLVEPLPENLLS